jgi:hypothetical protein
MKVHMIFVIILILFLSCTGDDMQNSSKKNGSKKNKVTPVTVDKIDEVSPENLSSLFFNRPVMTSSVKKSEKTVTVVPQPNAGNYKVIIDWMVTNKRYVKLKNVVTGEETIVREGDTSSNIILLERTLFTYKFKINGQIVEVKR